MQPIRRIPNRYCKTFAPNLSATNGEAVRPIPVKVEPPKGKYSGDSACGGSMTGDYAIRFTGSSGFKSDVLTLRSVGIANSGGQGKLMVSDGIVQVDGNVETRRTAKIRAGQTVECMGQLIKVV